MFCVFWLVYLNFIISSRFWLPDIQEINPVACFPLYINFFNSTIGWTLHRSFHFPVYLSFSRSVQSRPRLPVELTFFRRVSFVFFYFIDVKFHTQFLHLHWHFMSFQSCCYLVKNPRLGILNYALLVAFCSQNYDPLQKSLSDKINGFII
jgi:hypothetical protein